MEKVNVLITGVGGGGLGEQVIKALRLSKKLNLNLIGTDITHKTTGSRLVDFFYVVPRVNSSNYKETIKSIIEKHQISIIFAGSEAEIKFISSEKLFFDKLNVFCALNNKKIIDLCMDKYQTFKKLESIGVSVGKYKKINNIEDIYNIDYFPLVLKPSTGSGGSANVSICFDKEDLELTAKYMLKNSIDLVAQEYIESDEEWTIGVSSDENGEVLGCIAMKRFLNNSLAIREKLNRNGKTYVISSGLSQGQIVKDNSILAQSLSIAKQIGSTGPLNIQARVVNGKLYPFEINPRLSGTTSIRAMAGYNEPEAMIIKKLGLWDNNLDEYEELLVLRTIVEVVI